MIKKYEVLIGSEQIKIGFKDYYLSASQVLSFIQTEGKSGVWGDEFKHFETLEEAKKFFDSVEVSNNVFENNGIRYCSFGYGELLEYTFDSEDDLNELNYSSCDSHDIKTVSFIYPEE